MKDSSVIKFIQENLIHFNEIVLTGDFNFNILSNSSSNEFSSLVRLLDLSVVNTTIPTHFNSNSSSLLDLFLVSNSAHVLRYDQVSHPAFSRHDLIFVSYDWVYNQSETVTFSYPDYRSVNCQYLFNDAFSCDWESILSLSTVDEQMDMFTTTVNELFRKHVPYKTVNNVSPNCPWFNDNIRSLIRCRDKMYRNWKRFRLADYYSEFKKLRNKVISMIRKAKVRFYSHKLNVKQSTKKLWSNLKDIGVGKSKQDTITEVDLDDLNKFFTSCSNLNASCSDVAAPQTFGHIGSSGIMFDFNSFSEVDVGLALLSITSNAVGLDEMHPKFIKTLLPVLLPVITTIFNNILKQNTYPSIWKISKIIPTPKKSNPGPLDYRPIAILPFLSKVFEKLIHNQISSHIESLSLLNNFQSGFRKNRSCITALLKVSDDIRASFDEDMMTFLVLLDFSKAFDSVDHEMLLSKLQSFFNFSNSSVLLMKSYLSNRKQLVCANNKTSSTLPIFSGVPQGSILGPLLFAMFINDLSVTIKYCSYHKYADDVQIYISCKPHSIVSTTELLNKDLNSIHQWASHNKLILNAAKSIAIIFSREEIDNLAFCEINVGGSKLNVSESVRNLGMIFDNKLSWKCHIDALVGKIYGALRKLQLTSFYTPEATRMTLVKSLLVPLFSYGCELFRSADCASQRKLEIAFNSCVRYIFNLKRFDHVSKYRDAVLKCSLSSFFEYRSLLLLYNILSTGKPSYLYQKVHFGSSDRSRSLSVMRTKYKVTSSQFFPSTISCWNKLPLHVRREFGNRNFKNILLKYFTDQS